MRDSRKTPGAAWWGVYLTAAAGWAVSSALADSPLQNRIPLSSAGDSQWSPGGVTAPLPEELADPLISSPGRPADPSASGAGRSISFPSSFNPDPERNPWSQVRPEIGLDMEKAMTEEAEAEEEHQGLLRDRLHGRGPVALEYFYTGEVLSNTRGGLSTRNATQYEGLLNLAMRLEFEKTRLPIPGKFFLLFQQSHGRGLSTDFVGDAQIVSTIDSFGNMTQVSEYWWEGSLLDERLTVRLGKQDVNSEFHLAEAASDFVHSAYGIPPTLPSPTYPHNSAAVVLLLKVNEALVAKAGVWDGYPNGANWGFSGTGAAFTIAELEYSYKLFHRLPGVFDIGFSHLSPIDLGSEEFIPEQYTLYWDFEQAVYREDPCDEENEQGLSFFARFGTVYPRPEVDFKDYFGVGLVYQGLIPGRDDDRIGAGVNYLRHNLGGSGVEVATEVFYKAQLKPWAFVQPVVQFISTPSGIYRDSLVAGMRFQIVF